MIAINHNFDLELRFKSDTEKLKMSTELNYVPLTSNKPSTISYIGIILTLILIVQIVYVIMFIFVVNDVKQKSEIIVSILNQGFNIFNSTLSQIQVTVNKTDNVIDIINPLMSSLTKCLNTICS